jgi:hypothetical protein
MDFSALTAGGPIPTVDSGDLVDPREGANLADLKE